MSEQLKGWMSLQTNLADYALAEFPEHTIEGILPANSIILLTGDPKAGKSFIAQSWAHSVATGSEWFGRKVIPGGVAWVNPDGEHPKFIWERFSALENYTGEKIAYGETLAAIETFQVSNENQRENLLTGVREGLKLVIIDTLAAAAGTSNLSNQSEFAPIADFSKELIKAGGGHGTSVIWLHHTTKTDSRGVSGSQQILAMASQHYSVTNKKGFVILALEASRHGEAGLELPLAIESVELDSGRTSAVIVSGDRLKRKTSPRFRAALGAIFKEGNYEQGEEIPKAQFAKELQSQGIPSTTAYAGLVKATEDGLLIEHPSGKQMAYSFPVSQNFPKLPKYRNGKNPRAFPTIPRILRFGNWEKGRTRRNGDFLNAKSLLANT